MISVFSCPLCKRKVFLDEVYALVTELRLNVHAKPERVVVRAVHTLNNCNAEVIIQHFDYAPQTKLTDFNKR